MKNMILTLCVLVMSSMAFADPAANKAVCEKNKSGLYQNLHDGYVEIINSKLLAAISKLYADNKVAISSIELMPFQANGDSIQVKYQVNAGDKSIVVASNPVFIYSHRIDAYVGQDTDFSGAILKRYTMCEYRANMTSLYFTNAATGVVLGIELTGLTNTNVNASIQIPLQ